MAIRRRDAHRTHSRSQLTYPQIKRITQISIPEYSPTVLVLICVICVICGLTWPKIGLYLDGGQSHNTSPITGQGAGERV